MRVGFTGSRKPPSKKAVEALKRYMAGQEHDEGHSGDCRGADVAFHTVCLSRGMRTVGHIPSNAAMRAFLKYDEERAPLPYLVRNHAIVDACEILYAMPETRHEEQRSGTWATVRYARKIGRPIVLFFPDGTTERN